MSEAETLLRQLLAAKAERAWTLRELVAAADDREANAWRTPERSTEDAWNSLSTSGRAAAIREAQAKGRERLR